MRYCEPPRVFLQCPTIQSRFGLNPGGTMKRVVLVILIGLSLSVGGCAARAALTPQEQAQIQANANRKITCTKGDDCDMKWGRAITWVSQNSHWKVQLQNDYLIQTYTSMNGSPYSSFLVNKAPIDNGSSEIVMSSGCGNMFGCVPDETILRASFTNFIIGPAPTPTPQATGPSER